MLIESLEIGMYLMPLVGGILADRWLGTRKAITFGAALLVIGQLGLAIEGPPAKQSCGPPP